MPARGLVLVLLLPLAGCVGVTWNRSSRNVPVPAERLERLEAGRTDLAECLATLGAPIAVWEHGENGTSGAVLAYGWVDALDWGVNVSFPVTRRLSGSLDYDSIDRDLAGVLLFFGDRWVLRRWRAGLLREAVADPGLRRSAPVD